MRFRFRVLDLRLEVVRSLRKPMEKIGKADRELWVQIRKSASSLPMNLAEGNRRKGKDRVYHFTVAAGSADETLLGLLVSEAWGDLSWEEIERPVELLDEVQRVTWKLTH